jgi:hypothetical protein
MEEVRQVQSPEGLYEIGGFFYTKIFRAYTMLIGIGPELMRIIVLPHREQYLLCGISLPVQPDVVEEHLA